MVVVPLTVRSPVTTRSLLTVTVPPLLLPKFIFVVLLAAPPVPILIVFVVAAATAPVLILVVLAAVLLYPNVKLVLLANAEKVAPLSIPVVNVGLVDSTTDPVPVIAANSSYSASQSAAVVRAVPIHKKTIVVPGITVATRLPPEELTVRFPVETFSIAYDIPVTKVLVTGRTIV